MAGFVSVLTGLLWNSDTITTCLVFTVTFLLVYFNTRRRPYVPPGPALLPVVGNLFSLAGRDTFGVLEELRKKYGDVYGLYIGNELTVFLNGYEANHEALVRKASLFSVRPISSFHKLIIKEPAIIYANGQLWKEQRKFGMNCLNELYVKKDSNNAEQTISREIEHLLTKMGSFKTATDITDYINISIANVICSILFNERFDFDDDQFDAVLKRYNTGAVGFAKLTVLANCFPFASYIPGDLLGIGKVRRKARKNFDFIDKFIDKRRKVFDEHKLDTIADKFIKAIKDNEDMCLANTFTEEQHRATIADLLATGAETTATTMRWLILYVLRNPDIQRRIHKELDSILGNDQPCLSDRAGLPYTEAVVLETLRIASIAPLSVPHSVTRDCIFRGYLIPENCTVMININSINMDKSVWNEPNEFRPERFLTSDGKSISIPKEFAPFSIGPRSCLGESLARIELFLYTTSLFQKIKFSLPDGAKLPDTTGHLGMTYSPSRFQVCIEKR